MGATSDWRIWVIGLFTMICAALIGRLLKQHDGHEERIKTLETSRLSERIQRLENAHTELHKELTEIIRREVETLIEKNDTTSQKILDKLDVIKSKVQDLEVDGARRGERSASLEKTIDSQNQRLAMLEERFRK